jgi:probable HAF family extracellular repeat protein
VTGQCRYDVTVIEADDCDKRQSVITAGRAMNEHGDVVGASTCGAGFGRPFLWTPEDGFIRLPLPPGEVLAEATGINNSRQIILYGERSGWLWEDGVYTALRAIPPCTWVRPKDINDDGIVVGERDIDGCDQSAFIWSAESGFHDLGVMNGPASSATAINRLGDTVGWTGGATQEKQAFLWSGGRLVLLPFVPGTTDTWAHDISADGVIVGVGERPDRENLPVVRHDGEWQVLPILTECDEGIASHLNGAGQIVGHCMIKNGTRAVLWQHDRVVPIDALSNKPGIELLFAKDLNDAGQILAQGPPPGSDAFLLTPVNRPVGDLDIDCRVGPSDLSELLSAWGTGPSPADLDGDGTVAFSDLVILLGNWG